MIGWIIVIFVLVMVVFVLPFMTVMLILSIIYNRRERAIRNEAEAHRKILESTYDHIWNEIKSHCGISEEYRRSFNNIYPNLLDKDIDDDTMLNWILDCNIDFDPAEYVTVMDSIAEDRRRFVVHQRRMITLLREHQQLHKKPFARRLIKDQTMIRYVPVETNYDRWGKSL
ncbi:MAG: hypothetical protein IKP83_00665 [Bacteroidales bacterium]|nr:hypothetical protein [Bacteroidales bacterium]